VPKVDFISAPGKSTGNLMRCGGPKALVTGMARFAFEGRFRLDSIHPGHSLTDVEAATGFAFDRASTIAVTAPPTEEELRLIRGPVRDDLAEVYPRFAAAM
jgi:glutaconate CoA-transferase subunit B